LIPIERGLSARPLQRSYIKIFGQQSYRFNYENFNFFRGRHGNYIDLGLLKEKESQKKEASTLGVDQ